MCDRNIIYNNRQSLGFTIMEMVVVLGIFSIVSTIVTAVFFSTTRAQKQAAAVQLVQSELRFAMESMVNEVRQGLPDYTGYYAGNPITADAQSRLALRSVTDTKVQFRKNPDEDYLQISRDGGISWSIMTSSAVRVIKTEFYISPTRDPFAIDSVSLPNVQPRVTIIMSALPANTSMSLSPIFLQTTIVARSYKR